jgi:molybdopterin-containing oxidoreductase family membrane subunit
VIWYGNLPEETFYFRDRLGPQFVIDKGITEAAWANAWVGWDFSWDRLSEAYGWTSMLVWTCVWIVPFWVLLGELPKKSPWILGPVATVVLFGLWLERNLLVWPSVVKEQGWAWFGGIQIGIALGFLGAFALVFLIYTRVFPSLALPEKD